MQARAFGEYIMNVLSLCTLCDEGRDSIEHIIHTK